jgi:ABC-type nickel/cobalt efflux system permease component RcnA
MADLPGSAGSLLLFGFLLGVRHATDADHVVAVTTIVSRQRALGGSALIGAVWGAGHTLTLLAVGGAIILFGVVVPPRLGLAMEFAVGLMLVALGVLTLTGVGRVIREVTVPHAAGVLADGSHPHRHRSFGAQVHDGHAYACAGHAHSHPRRHGGEDHGPRGNQAPLARPDRSLGRAALDRWLRPLLVGLVHGLAGSAAVTFLVLTLVPEPAWAVAYLLVFGAGTVAGMTLITVVLAAPFAFTSARLPHFNWGLRVASGLLSFAFGLFLVYEIGFMAGGLFTDNPTWAPR